MPVSESAALDRFAACWSPTGARSPSGFSAPPTNWASARGHLLARGPLRPAPFQGGRGLPRRQTRRADPGLPGHRRHRRPRAAARGRCDPSRLRLSLGEPGLGPGLRGGRHHFRRSAPGGPGATGRQGRGPRASPRRPACRCCPAATSRCADQCRGAQPWPKKLGYPVIVKAAMGGGGRGHARGRTRRRAR